MQTSVEIERGEIRLRGIRHVPANHQRPLPAAVILHGFTADKLGPHKFLRRLSVALEEAGIASFRFDFAGSGESDGRFQDVTVSSEVADTHLILDAVRRDPEIDPTRIALVGHSMGGLVASMVAAERPEDVNRLALLAPAGNIREFAFGLARQAGISADAVLQSRMETFEWEGFLIGRAFALDLQNLEPFQRALPYRNHGAVLLVNGTQDATVPPGVAERYKAEVYGESADLRLITGADHTFSRRAWEVEAIALVCDFLRPLAAGASAGGARSSDGRASGQSGVTQAAGSDTPRTGAAEA